MWHPPRNYIKCHSLLSCAHWALVIKRTKTKTKTRRSLLFRDKFGTHTDISIAFHFCCCCYFYRPFHSVYFISANMRASSASIIAEQSNNKKWDATKQNTRWKSDTNARKMSVVNFILYLRGQDRIAFSGRECILLGIFFFFRVLASVREPVVNAQNAF